MNTRMFYAHEEIEDILTFIGSGASRMRDYCNDFQLDDVFDLDGDDAMLFAKDALDHASRYDWYTGGAINVYRISDDPDDPFRHRIWVPVEPDLAREGYMEDVMGMIYK